LLRHRSSGVLRLGWDGVRLTARTLVPAPCPFGSARAAPPVVDLLEHGLTKLCHSVTAPAVPRTQYQRLPVPQHHRCRTYLLTGRLLAR
jgi:hypothetical protein